MKMIKEMRFTNIAELVCEKDRISYSPSTDKWQIIDYEAADFSGKMLWADEKATPVPLTLKLGVQGKYRVYIGLINIRGDSSTGFDLLSDGAKRQFRAIRPPVCWKPLEWFEESYYATVDLTDECFVLRKPASAVNSALAWIRLVKADESEVKHEPCMAYHFDLDYFADDEYSSETEILGRMKMLRDGSPDIILHEKFPVYSIQELKDKGTKANWGKYYYDNLEKVESVIIPEAHSMGAKIYASFRIQAGGFGYFANHLNATYEDTWFDEHPEFRCVTRDGRIINTASFAYPEVRRRVVEMIVNGSKGFDGVCVFYHRGTLVAFEEPVKRMVYEKYGVDATRLPMSDPRLHGVMCHFINLFMCELREALDASDENGKEINAIVFHSPEKSKHFGYDVKAWIDEGLVDSISQGLMTHYEELDGLLDADGLIDIEKYKKALTERAVVCRNYSPDYRLVTEGAAEFMKICGNKADFYATLAWEGTLVENSYALVKGLKEIGVKKFISWNTNHKAKILQRLNVEKFYAAGNDELYEERKTTYLRTLSIAGDDISNYNTDWKG